MLLPFVLTLAALTTTPTLPGSSDPVTIRLANTFGSAASVASATIARNGNDFAIVQNVDYACFSPSNPEVASEFVVGPLPAGTYTVTATINFIPAMPGCERAPLVQTATFTVNGPAVPAMSGSGLLLLGIAVAGAALLALRVRAV